MKKLKYTSLILSAVTAVCLAGCSGNETKTVPTTDNIRVSDGNSANTPNNSNNASKTIYDTQKTTHVPANVNSQDISVGSETSLNSTGFQLDKVVRVKNDNGEGDYIYLGVRINNETDTEYTITSLNNFFLTLPDGTEVSSHIKPKMYATNKYKKCYDDPITIPANNLFTGFIAGGFIIPSDCDSFKVNFIPTLDNPNNKSNIITCEVTASDITDDDSSMK